MAVGLFFIFLEISRKARFLYVLFRWRSSWMTRETYAVAILYPALLIDGIWPTPWLHGLIGCAALFFLICVPSQRCIVQPPTLIARIVKQERTPAWR